MLTVNCMFAAINTCWPLMLSENELIWAELGALPKQGEFDLISDFGTSPISEYSLAENRKQQQISLYFIRKDLPAWPGGLFVSFGKPSDYQGLH